MSEARLPFMAVSPNLRTNRKFVRLKKLLGNPSERDLVGSLVMLWSQVFNDSPSGDISSWSAEEVADCAGWSADVPGTSGTFLGALVAARFVVDGVVNDWYAWGGYLYKSRLDESERKRRYREQTEQDRKQNAGKVGKPVPGTSAEVPGTSTLTNGTEPTERNGTNVRRETPIVVSLPSDPISEPVSTPEPPKPKRKPPETGALSVYLAAWTERYGEEPHPIGGEVAAANKVLHPFTPEDRERIVRAFVADDDGWLVEHAHPIGAITRHLDRIRAKLNGKLGTGRRPTPPLVGANHPELSPEERAAVDEARRQEDEARRARFGVAS